MEGLYLYCIREKLKNPLAISTKGIDEKGEVFSFAFREIEAIVSKVSLDEFGSEEIQKRAKEDLKWIKEKALIHEKIIEEAMRENDKILSLIPMRFGIIFKDEERLKETLEKDYLKIKEILDRIRGKQEWSVKVYLSEREKFEKKIKEENDAIKEKERKIAALPEGEAYFMEEELKEEIFKEAEKELSNTVEFIFEDLKKKTVDSVKNKILEKELIGRKEPMILNAAYLISEDKIEDFKKEIERLNQEIKAKGFYLEYSGPWPAFNFTYF